MIARPHRLVADRPEHERRARRPRSPAAGGSVSPSTSNVRCPAAVFSTISANRNCSPKPQAIVRQPDRAPIGRERVRDEADERPGRQSAASVSIYDRLSPVTIVRRAPSRAPARRRVVADRHRVIQQRPRRRPVAPIADSASRKHRIAAPDRRADRRDDVDAGGRIDGGIDAVAAGAERHGRPADQLGVDARRRSRRECAVHVSTRRRLRQPRVVVDDARVAALRLDDRAELLEPRAARERLAHLSLRVVIVARDAGRARASAPPAAPTASSTSVGPRPFSVSIDFDDFVGVADGAAERRVHRRQERFGPHAVALGDARPATSRAAARRPASS